MSSRGRRYHMISWVAERYGVHPQTLRLYEREGLICPPRSVGNTRLYDDETCERLEVILTLTRDLGVNLAGVEVVMRMKDQIDALQREVERLMSAVEREAARRGTVLREHALVPRPQRGLVPSEGE
ncbi:MAG: MerR family transcriptional regulator [Acidobacteriota bacterium]